MPIIINGGSRSAGGWWGKHLGDAEKNERVEVIEITGLVAETVPDAFREMQAVARGTKCDNYFYQANINPRQDERLTPAQWREAVDTLEKNLGLTGQPRFVVEHEKEGRTHRHVVWSRIDPERMTAISDSLTAPIHERTSRELEIKFDLERGHSILVPDRKTARPDRRPKKHETFRGMESGIDPEAVKADARRHWQSADNGQSFKAALEASGDYVLARGDRRDFVIIDRAGDDHSLARRLGVKAAEMRARMADLDPASLPNVQEAKAQQHTRQAERAASQQPDRNTAEPAAPIWDRDQANREWEAGIETAALGAQEARQQPGASAARVTRGGGPEPSGGTQRRSEPEDMRPLGKTAGEIRMAWVLSRTAEELEEALAARGIGLAEVSAEEAQQSQRTAAFAKETGNFARVLREKEIVAIDQYGGVHRFDQRTTGDLRPEIEARLDGFAGIDRAGLLNVADTKEVMQEASRERWCAERQAEREQARPASWIEQRIAECAEVARKEGATIRQDRGGNRVGGIEALTDSLRPEGRRETREVKVHGAEAFDALLADAGIVIARVTEPDARVLDSWREELTKDRMLGDAIGETYQGNRLDAVLMGELAAVTRNGDVYRINPEKLGAARSYIGDDLPGVIEAQARFKVEREKTAEFWAEVRAENAEDRAARNAAYEGDRTLHRHAAAGERTVEDTLHTADNTVNAGLHAGEGLLRRVGKIFESIISALADAFSPPPPPTKDQAERMARSAEEKHEARAEQGARAEREAQHWLIIEAQRQAAREREDAENDQERARRREQDRGYERER